MIKIWNNLTSREQLLIIICGVFVFMFLLFIALIKPISDRKIDSLRAMEEEKNRYDKVLELSALSTTSSQEAGSAGADTTSIREAATTTSRKVGIAISRIQPASDGSVSFWIDNSRTTEIMNWLILLNDEHAQQAQKVSLQKNNGEETLRGQFEFKGNKQ